MENKPDPTNFDFVAEHIIKMQALAERINAADGPALRIELAYLHGKMDEIYEAAEERREDNDRLIKTITVAAQGILAAQTLRHGGSVDIPMEKQNLNNVSDDALLSIIEGLSDTEFEGIVERARKLRKAAAAPETNS